MGSPVVLLGLIVLFKENDEGLSFFCPLAVMVILMINYDTDAAITNDDEDLQ